MSTLRRAGGLATTGTISTLRRAVPLSQKRFLSLSSMSPAPPARGTTIDGMSSRPFPLHSITSDACSSSTIFSRYLPSGGASLMGGPILANAGSGGDPTSELIFFWGNMVENVHQKAGEADWNPEILQSIASFSVLLVLLHIFVWEPLRVTQRMQASAFGWGIGHHIKGSNVLNPLLKSDQMKIETVTKTVEALQGYKKDLYKSTGRMSFSPIDIAALSSKSKK